MLWLTLILGFLLAILLWLLLAPLELRIDTNRALYQLRWKSIGKLLLVPESDDFVLEARLLFWHKQFRLIEMIARRKRKTPPEKAEEGAAKKKAKKQAKPFSFYWRKAKTILASLNVREAYCLLDTDDFILNAYLQPLVWALSRVHPKLNLYINYMGKQEVRLHILGRPGAVLLSLLR